MGQRCERHELLKPENVSIAPDALCKLLCGSTAFDAQASGNHMMQTGVCTRTPHHKHASVLLLFSQP